jgi:hypothetical protein
MFKIISAGWQCEEFMSRTLDSVAVQTRDDWQFMGVYDKSEDDGALKLWNWCDRDPMRRNYLLNLGEKQYAVRNQWTGLKQLGVEDDDIIVFLDLDGDRLAHPEVLQHVAEAYEDDTLVTYGSYKPIPDEGTSPPAIPFPLDVVVSNSYRSYIARPLTPCCFNHLRTMKGKVFNSLAEDQFRYHDSPEDWYTIGADYVFMIPALERAGGRYKCLTETLLLYNHDNPNADFRTHPNEGGVVDVLKRPALEPLL